MRSSDVAYIVNQYPLVYDKKMTRAGCIQWLRDHDLDIPPKSACTFCPYHSIGQWNALKRAGGPDWDRSVEVDNAIRMKRPKAALFVHPYRKPLAEAIEIPEDFGATQLSLEDLDVPCEGGFCFV